MLPYKCKSHTRTSQPRAWIDFYYAESSSSTTFAAATLAAAAFFNARFCLILASALFLDRCRRTSTSTPGKICLIDTKRLVLKDASHPILTYSFHHFSRSLTSSCSSSSSKTSITLRKNPSESVTLSVRENMLEEESANRTYRKHQSQNILGK
jgi:hypothetical protein